jgi:hypothetical protein
MWISVKDRLPDIDQTVLIVDAKGGFDVARYEMRGNTEDDYKEQPEFYWCYCCTAINSEITHWMPLDNPNEKV